MWDMNAVIFTSFRTMNEQHPDEADAARSVGVPVVEHLYDIPAGSTVIPRYRAIPFGNLLQDEVEHLGSHLINSYREHRNIADSSAWAYLLDGSDGEAALTPRQYGVHDIPHLPEGEWFVKGETNSLKLKWLEGSYAPTTADLHRIVSVVQNDTYIGNQDVVIKPFQRYRKLATGLNGQPIFHERRVFVLDSQIASEAFYWSSWTDEVGEVSYDRTAYESALQDAISRVSHLARFVVIDMAEYADGSWGVVELNDGSMSGLSDNDPAVLWGNVASLLH